MRALIPLSIILYLSTLSTNTFANTDTTGRAKKKTIVPPEFPGKEEGLAQYLASHIQYPKQAQEKEIDGIVLVRFMVDENGKVVKPRLVKRPPDKSLGEEALRVVGTFPDWKPGAVNGKQEAMIINLPINFRLMEATGVTFLTKTDVPPTFSGGDDMLHIYLSENTHYPEEAQAANIEGTAQVHFTINEAGQIINAANVGPKLGGHLDMEALRLVRSMPKWKPGMVAGKPVPVDCDFKLSFSLKELKKKKRRDRVYPRF